MSQLNDRLFFIDLYENEQGQHTFVRRYIDDPENPEPLWTLSLGEIVILAMRCLAYVKVHQEGRHDE